jgi:hypothetical protein
MQSFYHIRHRSVPVYKSLWSNHYKTNKLFTKNRRKTQKQRNTKNLKRLRSKSLFFDLRVSPDLKVKNEKQVVDEIYFEETLFNQKYRLLRLKVIIIRFWNFFFIFQIRSLIVKAVDPQIYRNRSIP